MSERGHAAVELALAVAALLLPVAIVLLAFGPWSERRVTAEAIAAEAARSAAIELDLDAGMESIVAQIRGLGFEDPVKVGWCGAEPSSPAQGVCPFTRGSVVSVTVSLWAPVVTTPWGDVGGVWVVGEHSEPIDLYRSMG